MRYLKKNTAVIISVGPFYDKTDGVTIENSLTITNERITLVADTDDGSAPTIILDNVTGATSGTDNDLNYISGCDAGLMQLELTQANTNRVGRLMLTITDAANHVPVFHEFMVLDGAVYDSLVLGTDKLAVDTQEISSDSTAADNAELMFDGTGYAGGTIKLGVDAVAVSGDSTAADNLETMLDGTGGQVLSLGQLNIVASGNNSALVATGAGTGKGIAATGGASGAGIYALGGATANGYGLYAQAQSNNCYGIHAVGSAATESGGIKGVANTSGEGIEGLAAGNGHGLYVVGAGTGEGIHATAGAAANGHGAHFEGVGANSSGLLLSRGGAGGDDLNFANNDVTIANVTTVNGLAANVITAAAIATNAIDADALAADAVTEIQAGLATSVELAAVADGYTLTDVYDTTVAVGTAVGALNDLSAADVNAEVVDVLRTDTLPDSYSTDGDQPTIAQAVLAILQFLTEKAVSGTTVTVNKPDGSTAAMTFTLDSATDPTSITRAS